VVLEFTSTYEDYLRKGTDREFWLVNTNRLVKFNPIVDGLKTGYTTGAGYCLTATGLKNDMRLIATVMGEETITDRSNEVTSLLDYGYANYKVDKLIDSNTVIDTVSLDLASQNLNIVAKEDLSRLSKKTDKLGEITYQLNMSSIKLPLKKGDTVGNVDIYLDGKKVETVDVTVLEDTSKVSFGNLFMRYLKDIMQGKMIVS
jgi:D-alanyl-D-alanine carboxypeptidase (penicillin-binding protein 5/6)